MTTEANAGTAGDGKGAAGAGDAAAAAAAAASAAAGAGKGAADQGQQGAANGGQAQDKPAAGVNSGSSSAVQNWRDGLEGERLEFANRVASIPDLVDSAINLRKANGSMVKVPQQGAPAEEVAKFHKAIGVPEKPDQYKFDLGRDLTEQDKPVISKVSEIFHANGVPASAATAVSKAVAELAAAQLGEADRVASQHREAAEAALNKEWGADKDRNLQVALRAVEVFGGQELKDYLNSTIVNGAKLGDHPVLAKAFAKVGLRMGEGEFIGPANAGERQSVQDRINTIMQTHPPGSDGYKLPAVQRELAELHGQLHGHTPIVGSGGRAA